MKINNIKVTLEDFETLAADFKTMRSCLIRGNPADIEKVINKLTGYEKKLSANLAAEKQRMKEEEHYMFNGPANIYDKVEIISVDNMDNEDFIEEVGWITYKSKAQEYPYSIKFQNENLEVTSKFWSWRRGNFKIIERGNYNV